mmetsp:Transcript_2284/g.3314  ORF Transcript_2284/g.3314 Transcript_2284/m.3314 type:complete len:306 (+) Transcript_2284:38-955(+)
MTDILKPDQDTYEFDENEYPTILTGRVSKDEFKEGLVKINLAIKSVTGSSIGLFLKQKIVIIGVLACLAGICIGILFMIIGGAVASFQKELAIFVTIGPIVIAIGIFALIVCIFIAYNNFAVHKNKLINDQFKEAMQKWSNEKNLKEKDVFLSYESDKITKTKYVRRGNRTRKRKITLHIPKLKVTVKNLQIVPPNQHNSAPPMFPGSHTNIAPYSPMGQQPYYGPPQNYGPAPPPPQHYSGPPQQQPYYGPPQQYYGPAPPPPQQQQNFGSAPPPPHYGPPHQYGSPNQYSVQPQYNDNQPPPL